MIDPTATHPLLRELNDALAIEGAEPVDWIVCGGTALGILGLVQRPTRDFGLPPGCTERLTPRTIGTHLTLRLPDRRDLIAFKLFAAVDAAHGRQPVHKSDLRALAPNEEELREFLQELGHEDLAYYIA